LKESINEQKLESKMETINLGIGLSVVLLPASSIKTITKKTTAIKVPSKANNLCENIWYFKIQRANKEINKIIRLLDKGDEIESNCLVGLFSKN
jgi:hypothetical protein